MNKRKKEKTIIVLAWIILAICIIGIIAINSVKAEDIAQIPLQDAKEAYYFLGHCNYQLRNLDKAVVAYKKVAELDPADQNALLYAGNVYLEQDSYPEAEKEYRGALRRFSGDRAKKAKVK